MIHFYHFLTASYTWLLSTLISTFIHSGDVVEGTNNRIVTIEGTPLCAQTAHTLIIHKLRQELQEN